MTLHGSARAPKADECQCLGPDDCGQILDTTTSTTTASASSTSILNSESDTILLSKSASISKYLDAGGVKFVLQASPQCSSKLYSQLFDEITGDLESIKNNFSANEMQVLEAFNMQQQIHKNLEQLSKQNHKLEDALQEANTQKAALVNDLRNKVFLHLHPLNKFT